MHFSKRGLKKVMTSMMRNTCLGCVYIIPTQFLTILLHLLFLAVRQGPNVHLLHHPLHVVVLVVPEPKSSQKRRMVRTKVGHGQRSKGEAAKENSGEGKVQRETTAEGTLPLPSELARKRAIKTNPPSGVKRGG